MPTTLVKACAEELSPFFQGIVNSIIKSAKYPKSLKESALIPILKKKGLDTEDLKNYRPVSQGSFLNKVIDRSLHLQITKYLEKYELESPLQTGYKAHHSTETLLLALNNHLLMNFEGGKIQILVTLDFSAAFDCIRQPQLKQTLEEQFGFSGTALDLLKDYFSGRSYSITIDGVKSKKQMLEIGAGQGTTLSCKGFSLATNQLSLLPGKFDVVCYQFADDLSLVLSFFPTESIESVKDRLIQCLNVILEYCVSHGLQLNSDKTNTMVIGKEGIREAYQDMSIIFDGAPIEFQKK